MRAIKIVMVTVTMAASVVVGVAGTASAAPEPKLEPSTRWCC
jgi:hypothetical protein